MRPAVSSWWLGYRGMFPKTNAADPEGHHVMPVEICQMRAVYGREVHVFRAIICPSEKMF